MEAIIQEEMHRLPRYRTFCRLYGIPDFQSVVTLYDVDELMEFLPTNPTFRQKEVLQKLVGTIGVKGFFGYEKSNNTLELMRRWQEITCNGCRGVA